MGTAIILVIVIAALAPTAVAVTVICNGLRRDAFREGYKRGFFAGASKGPK